MVKDLTGSEHAVSENHTQRATVVAEVPTVLVMLTQSVKLLLQKTCAVQVELNAEQARNRKTSYTMTEARVIQKSHSTWVSAVVLVRKKDGS